MFNLSEAHAELISTLLGDAEQFGCDPIDTVEAIAFFLNESGIDQPKAEAIAREVVGICLH